MGFALAGRSILWGGPSTGGPHVSQLTMGDTSLDPIEEGLKALIQSNTGLFLGPILIGFIADMVLFGVMTAQLIRWTSYAIEDRWFIKVIVGWCALFGTIASIFNLAYVHHIFVNHFGTFRTIAATDLSSWLGIIASLTSAGVQLFYCDRAYRLSGQSKILAGVIFYFILCSIVGGIGSKITSNGSSDPASVRMATIFIYLYTSGAMDADIIITVSIMWCLSKSRSGFVQTDQLVNKLLTISAETQLPPTLMATSFSIIFAYKTTKAAAHPDQVIIDVTSNLTGFFMQVFLSSTS
ncbi:uncharacterized protein IL334_002390 [Kwoniella shivajii]|uniref:DUF6534 domain-containing protein n=1 Tax=Kwoniella shivajii TaxID=564305 RepID=A0ABZ1CVT3_9TREE|nr:hypothetical protein IL334_002390 [Kwoniella shivajii]